MSDPLSYSAGIFKKKGIIDIESANCGIYKKKKNCVVLLFVRISPRIKGLSSEFKKNERKIAFNSCLSIHKGIKKIFIPPIESRE